jgi:glycosyltransferase involved in cell wall biosynthesis
VRVVLVGSYPIDLERVQGGVEASFSTLVSGLAEFPDLNLHVVTFVPGLDAPIHREVGGVPVDYLPTIRRLRTLTLHIRERRALATKLAALRPDVVHAQDIGYHGFMCLKTADPERLVVSIHGINRAERKFVTNPVTRVRVRIAIAIESYCIRNARYLVQPTRYPEQFFGDEIRGRIWDVGNPIADHFFSIEPSPETGRMMYTGAFIPRKRLLDLVEAMPRIVAAIPTAHLRAIGFAADSGYADRVRQRIADLGVEDRITFLHGLSAEELFDEYRHASVLVLPSGEETSPMVIGEAMAAHVPVVATRVGGVPSLVDEGRTGHIVEPGDVDALADRIAHVLGDAARARAMGEAGHAKATGNYRVEAVAARVRSVYDEVARRRYEPLESLETSPPAVG